MIYIVAYLTAIGLCIGTGILVPRSRPVVFGIIVIMVGVIPALLSLMLLLILQNTHI